MYCPDPAFSGYFPEEQAGCQVSALGESRRLNKSAIIENTEDQAIELKFARVRTEAWHWPVSADRECLSILAHPAALQR